MTENNQLVRQSQIVRPETNLTLVQDQSIEVMRARQGAMREIIRDTVCRGATNAELDFICAYQDHMQLDVLARQVWAYKQKTKDQDKYVDVLLVFPSIDGYRVLADRTGLYDGSTAVEYCDQDENWSKIWNPAVKGANPFACRIYVYRKDRKIPTEMIVHFDHFAKKGRDQGGTQYLIGNWKTMGPYMLSITAERQGLKRTFQNHIRGESWRNERALDAAPDPDILDVEQDIIGPGDTIDEDKYQQFRDHVERAGADAAHNRTYSFGAENAVEAEVIESQHGSNEQADAERQVSEQQIAERKQLVDRAVKTISRLSKTRQKQFFDETEARLGKRNLKLMEAWELEYVLTELDKEAWSVLFDLPDPPSDDSPKKPSAAAAGGAGAAAAEPAPPQMEAKSAPSAAMPAQADAKGPLMTGEQRDQAEIAARARLVGIIGQMRAELFGNGEGADHKFIAFLEENLQINSIRNKPIPVLKSVAEKILQAVDPFVDNAAYERMDKLNDAAQAVEEVLP